MPLVDMLIFSGVALTALGVLSWNMLSGEYD